MMGTLFEKLNFNKTGISISTNRSGSRVSKTTQNGNVSISSNGNVGVTLKTPIKGVKIKFNKKLFK